MKRTLRKRAKGKKTHRIGVGEWDLLILFAAVLTLFFAFLSSTVLGSVVRSTVTMQAKIDRITSYIDAAEMRLDNERTLRSLNSMNQR